MHAGRHYSLKEVLTWTRRDIYFLLVVAAVPTLLYELAGWKWLTIPWVPIALIGTAVAFLVGFKNNATYDRMWEARRSWGAIVNNSRTWGMYVKGLIANGNVNTNISQEELAAIQQRLIYRHLAWLAALRFQLREPRVWENMSKPYNAEYRRKSFSVAEQESTMDKELAKYLSPEELANILERKNKATQILHLQSNDLKTLHAQGLLTDYSHVELNRTLAEFYNQQGVCERIKNFPYPRQFATANLYFVRLFEVMVPFGMLQEFSKLGDNFVWLTIPFSALVCWVFNTMEKIGESTENPFEGSANDIPMTALSRTIEIDLREMLEEKELPQPLQPVHNILL
jgi:putative membrane protein